MVREPGDEYPRYDAAQEQQRSLAHRWGVAAAAIGLVLLPTACDANPYDERQAPHGNNRVDNSAEQAAAEAEIDLKTKWDTVVGAASNDALSILQLMGQYESSRDGDEDVNLRWGEVGDKGGSIYYGVYGNEAGRREFYEQGGYDMPDGFYVDRDYPIIYSSIEENGIMRVVYAEKEDEQIERLEYVFQLAPGNIGVQVLEGEQRDTEIDEFRPYRDMFIGAVTRGSDIVFRSMTMTDGTATRTVRAVRESEDFVEEPTEGITDFRWPAVGEDYTLVEVDGRVLEPGAADRQVLDGVTSEFYQLFEAMRSQGCLVRMDGDSNCVGTNE